MSKLIAVIILALLTVRFALWFRLRKYSEQRQSLLIGTLQFLTLCLTAVAYASIAMPWIANTVAACGFVVLVALAYVKGGRFNRSANSDRG